MVIGYFLLRGATSHMGFAGVRPLSTRKMARAKLLAGFKAVLITSIPAFWIVFTLAWRFHGNFREIVTYWFRSPSPFVSLGEEIPRFLYTPPYLWTWSILDQGLFFSSIVLAGWLALFIGRIGPMVFAAGWAILIALLTPILLLVYLNLGMGEYLDIFGLLNLAFAVAAVATLLAASYAFIFLEWRSRRKYVWSLSTLLLLVTALLFNLMLAHEGGTLRDSAAGYLVLGILTALPTLVLFALLGAVYKAGLISLRSAVAFTALHVAAGAALYWLPQLQATFIDDEFYSLPLFPLLGTAVALTPFAWVPLVVKWQRHR